MFSEEESTCLPLKLTHRSSALNSFITGPKQKEAHLLTLLTHLDDNFFVYLSSSEGQCVRAAFNTDQTLTACVGFC